ncbi:MAG: hypothetical protein MUF01_04815 [Bryobacterales bacterium]|jgi:hypothetical protein|nr:hypothetical protein [Bryobacterales bacterium]
MHKAIQQNAGAIHQRSHKRVSISQQTNIERKNPNSIRQAAQQQWLRHLIQARETHNKAARRANKKGRRLGGYPPTALK